MRRDDPWPADLLPAPVGGTDLARVYARWRQAFLRGLSRFRDAGISAEDALHDAVVRHLAAEAPLTGEDQTRAYLHRIVRNGTAHELRERQAGRRLQTVPLDELSADTGAWAQVGEGEGDGGPLQAAAQRQRLVRLGDALDELPERQREAFVLHRFDGLTQDEVAARMGISRRMVVKHLSRALAYCEARVQYASAEQMHRLHAPVDNAATPR